MNTFFGGVTYFACFLRTQICSILSKKVDLIVNLSLSKLFETRQNLIRLGNTPKIIFQIVPYEKIANIWGHLFKLWNLCAGNFYKNIVTLQRNIPATCFEVVSIKALKRNN